MTDSVNNKEQSRERWSRRDFVTRIADRKSVV